MGLLTILDERVILAAPPSWGILRAGQKGNPPMRTMEWNNQEQALVMIDQRLLPGEYRLQTYRDAPAVAEAIRDMVVRGAPAWAQTPDAARAFAPTGDLKKLYRKLAQKIHPDRARDEADRAWRTQLMSEANRAYRAGDQTGLAEVLSLWQEGSGTRAEPETDTQRLAGQVAALKRRVAEIEGELNRLFGSKLYELFTAAQIARRTGRDLLQEMALRLDADIEAARARLAPVS